jgi:uncharacterized membrane protein (UPF0182 family)
MPQNLGPIVRYGAIAVGVLLLLVLLNWLRGIYGDLLWFGNLGYAEVFRTILYTRIWTLLLGAALFAGFAAANVYITYRFGRGPEVAPLPEETLRFLRPAALYGSIGIILVAAIIFGATIAAQWELILSFINSTPFGKVDPQFGRDVGFYVFKLPLYHLIQSRLLAAVIVSLLFSMGMYFVHFNLRGAVFTFTNPVRIHLSVLGALLLFILAWGYRLSVLDLVFSSSGAVDGATYTDVTARIPALLILMVVVILAGLILLANAFFLHRVRLIVGIVLLWFGGLILLNGVVPAVVQRIQVNPNELRRETPYILRNIEMTRAAFALDRITEEDYELAPEGRITAEVVARNLDTVENIRLWDHRPFRSLMNQIQFFRPYYTFPSADVDRYIVDVDGQPKLRQVMLATRELDIQNLPEEAQSWVNRKLQYTHGYGAVMAPVTDFTEDGEPVFYLQDLDPTGIIPLTQPQVYYGESREEFVIVNSNQAELDFEPEVGPPQYKNYEGTGGVQLSSFLRRLVYAWQFRDINVLISGEINPDSRIQYFRSIQERIEKVAPFLTLDLDPYIVVSEGRLFWIQDAYTVTERYPYSTPITRDEQTFNYIRNSVKIVLDVYNGGLDFYIAEPEDPLVLTKQKIFPVLFKSLDQMPEDLRAHIRYPLDYFAIQAEQYLVYHMTDPTEFFNKADAWSVPDEFVRGASIPMEPYYLNMRLPGEATAEFVLLRPFTLVGKEDRNMVAWLAARSDGEHYGKLTAFAFPKGIEWDGPGQVEKRIDIDPKINQTFTLLCEAGAGCIRGNLLVIPMEDRILYAEPLYLQAGDFPQLKRVILADSAKVVMGCTLDGAMALLTGILGEDPRKDPVECLSAEVLAEVRGGQLAAPGAIEAPLPETPPVATAPGGALAQALRRELGRINDAFMILQEQLGELQDALQGLGDLVDGKVR